MGTRRVDVFKEVGVGFIAHIDKQPIKMTKERAANVACQRRADSTTVPVLLVILVVASGWHK